MPPFERRACFIYALNLKEESLATLGYDIMTNVVVFADDSKQARTLASGEAGDEGAAAWLSPATSKLRKIGFARRANGHHLPRPSVIVRDFNAG